MNEYILRITPQRQLAILSWMLIVYGILLSIYVYFFGFTLQPTFAYIFCAVFLLDICPALIAHVQYLIANRGFTLIINREFQTIECTTPKYKYSYKFEDILSMQHISSYGGGSWFSFSEYRYFKFTFKDNQQIIVTCLMVADIKNTLERLLKLTAQKRLKIVAFID